MPRTFSEFMAGINFMEGLRATIERVGLEEQRRKMISQVLGQLGRQLEGLRAQTDIYTPQVQQLATLTPIALQATTTPQDVLNVVSAVSQAVSGIQAQREQVRELQKQIEENRRKLAETVAGLDETQVPPEYRPFIASYKTSVQNVGVALLDLASVLAQTGNVQSAVQVISQVPNLFQGLPQAMLTISAGEREATLRREQAKETIKLQTEAEKELIRERGREQERLALLQEEITKRLIEFETRRKADVQKELEEFKANLERDHQVKLSKLLLPLWKEQQFYMFELNRKLMDLQYKYNLRLEKLRISAQREFWNMQKQLAFMDLAGKNLAQFDNYVYQKSQLVDNIVNSLDTTNIGAGDLYTIYLSLMGMPGYDVQLESGGEYMKIVRPDNSILRVRIKPGAKDQVQKYYNQILNIDKQILLKGGKPQTGMLQSSPLNVDEFIIFDWGNTIAPQDKTKR